MSSVIAIQTYDRVWIGADSAVSTQIGGNTYRLHEDGQKLFQVGDKVIFCSGIMDLAAAIMKEYEAAADHSLPNLQKIARRKCAEYTAEHPEVKERRGMFVELMIAYYDKGRGKTVVASISPYHNDFEIVERTLNSPMDFAVWAGGIRTQQATDAAMAKLRETLDVNLTYKYAFRAISYEGIGGDLTVYEIDAAGMRETLRHTIREKPGIKRLTRDVLQKAVAELVIAERIVGQQINGVGLSIGSGNNITYINPNGIAAGHATFSSAPFRVDMQGNVVARKITLTGTVENSDIVSGTITGALIRTAASGARFEASSTGWRTYDSSSRQRISIDINNQYGMSAISFARSDGSALGYINGGDSLFQITSLSDIMIAAPGRTITMQGYTRFNDGVEFDGGVSGISISSVSGLQSQLNSLSSQISRVPDNSEIATNMNFDPNTRNLKLYSASGTTLATVNIP